jgi:Protein of unknown function (DUF2914)/Tetratricopeptide repeat
MPEQRDPRSIIDAAEEAAAAGNYAAAEELLREAALLQESSLGLLHPDLANTLNNLGVVCERTENPVDAEDCFRRACAIATAVLPPDHPFVATSRKNLRDFCEARGIPVDAAAPPPAVTANLEEPATASPDPPHESEWLAESPDFEPVHNRSFGPLWIGTLTAGAVLIVILLTARTWFSSTNPRESSAENALSPTREVPSPPHTPSSPEPIPLPTVKTKAPVSGRDGVRTSQIATALTPTRATVVKARLCAELEEWRCDPPDRPVPPGLLFFYTQVKSSRPTSVTHRWYRGNRLYQSVDIRVQASPSGYRTYSRHTMSSESAGDWRVELRAEDGTVLHEERFSVR